MRDEIAACLANVEAEKDCRVLYACESGSRAWGFASPDSDYDVRFVYMKSREWYLRLEQPRDTIEAMLPGDIDLAGWDLRKTLRLFQRGNDSLYEWLGSPIVYSADTTFHARLAELVPAYFNPKSSMFHYLKIAENALADALSQGTIGSKKRSMFHYLKIAENSLADALSQGTIGIKRLFYVLRPLAACEWIFARRSPPPTAFAEILAGIELDADVSGSIRALLARKKEAQEKKPIAIPPPLAEWIERGTAANTARAKEMEPTRSPGWEPLNDLMRASLESG